MEQVPGELPVVVIGGSAGSLLPLRQIIAGLPPTLPAAVCVAVHMPQSSRSALATVLANVGQLPAAFAEEGVSLAPGTVRVAPPGHHLLVRGGHLALWRGARENRSRPAIDPLFRSAAANHGPRVISVLLSGTLADGAAGTAAVARAGGVTMVQEPADAQFPEMPRNALATGAVKHVLPARRMPILIEDLVQGLLEVPAAAPGEASPVLRAGRPGNAPPYDTDGDHPRGKPEEDPVDRGFEGPALDLDPPDSSPSCPACGGVLHVREPLLQYLCRLGHRYSPESLVHDQEHIVEDALWVALRTLKHEASLATRVRDRAAARGDRGMELRFDARRASAEARSDRIRRLLRGTKAASSRFWPDVNEAGGDREKNGPPSRQRRRNRIRLVGADAGVAPSVRTTGDEGEKKR